MMKISGGVFPDTLPEWLVDIASEFGIAQAIVLQEKGFLSYATLGRQMDPCSDYNLVSLHLACKYFSCPIEKAGAKDDPWYPYSLNLWPFGSIIVHAISY